MADGANPTLGWNLARDVGALLEFHFMLNALLAGTIVAMAAGVTGWVMLLRREAFAGHTLAMMAFPGAGCAALLGIPAAWGYFGWCGMGALALAALGGERGAAGERSAATGGLQALALAAGFLFVSLYGGVLGDLESLLFGDILGVSDHQVALLAIAAGVLLCALAAIGRPLLLASIDPEGARVRRVPVRALATAFLLVLGAAVAATSLLTGALLVFALLVGPPAAAQALTARPGLGLGLSVALGLLTVWLGLGAAYFSIYPAGFFIATISTALYVLARALAALRARRMRVRAAALRAAG